MDEGLRAIGLIFTLAILVEGLIEYFGVKIPADYKRYVAAVVGVLLCLAYGADLLAILGYQAQIAYIGSVLTGIVIGRGSNYVNDFISRTRVLTAPATTVAAAENKAKVYE